MSFSGLRAEQLLTSWLDAQLYPRLKGHSNGFMTSMSSMLAFISPFNLSWGTLQDEKATLHYLQRPLPTFASELSHLRNGKENRIIARRAITTAYMLVWPLPQAHSANINSLKGGHVDTATYAFSALSREGLDETRCAALVETLSSAGHEGKYDLENPNIWAYRSPAYAEAPVNLVIRRSWLAKLAIWEGTVSSEKSS